jgi:hypothetical protein
MKNAIRMPIEFANADESMAVASFTNELNVAADGWAQLAPFGDYPGRAMLRQADGSHKIFPALQRLDRSAAEAMVAKFKSPWQAIKRYVTGCPIYVGHPDVPAFANEYPDKVSKGMITDLQVRDDGLYCKPIFTNEGSDLVENKRYRAFSGYWSADATDEQMDGKPIFRPGLLKSAGLTNNPNLPVHMMNEQKTKAPDMKKIIAWLGGHGITVANEATEEQIEAGLKQLDPKIASIATLNGEKTTLANEKQTLTTTVTARDNTITSLTTERDTLRTNFANERKTRIDGLLDAAVTAGKITAAQRPDWATKLAVEANFANESEALGKLQKTMQTESKTLQMGDRKVSIANASDRRDALQTLVKTEMETGKVDYDTAFARVQKNNPALFEAMKPAAK